MTVRASCVSGSVALWMSMAGCAVENTNVDAGKNSM